MTIKAEVVADSISPYGKRIVSLQVRFPRFILPEVNTHRAFSRSFSSSRAIPITKLIEDILENTAMPVEWGKNRPGMQATELLSEEDTILAEDSWFEARDQAIAYAETLSRVGAHKQIANRLLEPFSHANGIITATEWDNFFELRDHPDAQPEMRVLAVAMKEAMLDSQPVQLSLGQWHMPYIKEQELELYGESLCLQMSTARCARASYNKHDGTSPNVDEDLFLYERLVGSVPIHASPCEHQAEAAYPDAKSRNFKGWMQHRELVEWKLWQETTG